MKTCNHCREDKPQSHFSKNAKYGDGLDTLCRACKSAKERAWYVENKVKKQLWVERYKESRKVAEAP